MMDLVKIVESVEEIDAEKVALMDLEGTLTSGKRKVPEGATPEHMHKVLEEGFSEGSQEVGYWSGIHLLAGEQPKEYFERMNKWKEGEVTVDEFENDNLEMWNNLIEETDHGSAKEFLDWYNNKFLNLRPEAKKLVEICQEAGYKVGIVSHTSTSLSKLAAEQLEADYVFPTWSFRFEKGKFIRAEQGIYAEEKAHLADHLREVGVKKIVFFGNGQNDVNIAEKSDEGFMVENKQEVDYESLDVKSGSFKDLLGKFKQELEVKA